MWTSSQYYGDIQFKNHQFNLLINALSPLEMQNHEYLRPELEINKPIVNTSAWSHAKGFEQEWHR